MRALVQVLELVQVLVRVLEPGLELVQAQAQALEPAYLWNLNPNCC